MVAGLALLSATRLKSARACQRLHHYEYELGYRPALEADDLRFGTLFHRALEVWWKGWQLLPDRRLEMALAAVATEADIFDRVRAEELMRAYHYRWVGEPYDVLGVETRFEGPLRNPTTGATSRTWRLAGKLDVVVRDRRDGLVRVVEHKTSGEDITPGSAYWLRLRMDGQVSVYYEGATFLGHQVAGCLYDVVGKPGLRPLAATPPHLRKYTQPTKKEPVPRLYANQREKDETPEEFRLRLVEDIAADPAGYFQRGDVVRLEAEMDEALYDIWQTGQQIREAQLAKRAPRNPDACVRYGRTCPFFDVCTGAASLEDPTKFTKKLVPHPELAGEGDGLSKEESAA